MPDFSALARKPEYMPEQFVGVTAFLHRIDPSRLASYPVAADTIRFGTLPRGAQIISAAMRVSGDIGAATSTLQLQAKRGALATENLTNTLAATAAGSIVGNAFLAPAATDAETLIQVAVGTAALDAAGDIEVMVLYSQAPNT